jgi:MYM-type Zinc finger with FCS sequence motif
MRDALPPSPDGLARSGFTCHACGQVVVTTIEGLYHNPPVGSTQRFCSPACRQAAWRRRRAGAAEHTPRQHTGGRGRKLTNDEHATNDTSRGQYSTVARGSVFSRR